MVISPEEEGELGFSPRDEPAAEGSPVKEDLRWTPA